MAGAGENEKYELEQWKKSLLSRDFDLVHTQLLLLDGDVTPSERVQLVQEIFTAVKQIEELTSEKFNSDNARTSSRQAHMTQSTVTVKAKNVEQRAVPKSKLRAALHNPQAMTVKTEHGRQPSKRVNQLSLEKSDKTENLQTAIALCPICETDAKVLTKGSRDDWYCNSCRAFKMRLEKMFSKSKQLPFCNHKGRQIGNLCRGCRRFKLEEFWLTKRQHLMPFQLPLMSEHHPHEEKSSTPTPQDSPNIDAEHSDSEPIYDSDFE